MAEPSNSLARARQHYQQVRAELEFQVMKHFPPGSRVIIRGRIRGVVHAIDETNPSFLGVILEHGSVRWFDVIEIEPEPPRVVAESIT